MGEFDQGRTTLSFWLFISKKFSKKFGLWFLASLGIALEVSLRPYIVGLILDNIALAARSKNLSGVFAPVVFYLCILVFSLVLYRLRNWVMFSVVPEIKRLVAQSVIDTTMQHSDDDTKKEEVGEFANKVSDLLSAVPKLVSSFFDDWVYNALTLAFAFATFAHVGAIYAYLMLGWFLVVLCVIAYSFSGLNKMSSRSASDWSFAVAHMVDVVTNVINVKLSANKKHERDIFLNTLSSVISSEKKKNKLLMFVYLFQSISFYCLQAISVVVLCNGLKSGVTSVGDFAVVIGLNTAVFDCLWPLSESFTIFFENCGKFKHGFSLIRNFEAAESKAPKALSFARGEISFKNVSFGYEGRSLIFENKNISLFGGQKVAIVGSSGSGKSTFIKLILNLIKTKSGKVLIDGQDVSALSPEELGSQISIIPQEPPMFNRSILENIRYGRLTATDEQVFEAAKQAHVYDFVMGLPDKFNTVVGENGALLSGGQKQRIAIARAILKRGSILIFDESTSALDVSTEALVYENIFKIFKNKTIIFISHRLQNLKMMDRILVFHDGKIIEDGAHKELISRELGVYKGMLDSRVENLFSNHQFQLN